MTREELEAAIDVMEGHAWKMLVDRLGKKTITVVVDAARAHLATLAKEFRGAARDTGGPAPSNASLASYDGWDED